ncbi:cytochrome c biogenesis protein CcdA [Hathewaya histolytica]|uniref:Cytochrome C biogenesis protein transmembrane region family n=1 Tax=Hathewaya histolytica TaxID=1498 RepID=A0A4U9RF96_HATHI|nr:cytochrome c biogenesis protein CcdA [Hathewaya histolytica]VTQ89073.1 cytochrome C biogenesis protein transmembrane region family [Hathewaya histolytica]
MFKEIISANNISFLLVFIEGILSFFSPCVIPLLPIYIGYLAGNAKKENSDGTITYERKKVFLHTIFFVLGISFAFFILGLSFSVLGKFLSGNKLLFTRLSGIVIIIFGLVQIGFLNFNFLKGEHRLNFNLNYNNMNPLMAFVMGFTFSFAWTPCVGPALSSVLILASSAKSALVGNVLVVVYAVGFSIPFLLLGLFTTQVLNFLKAKRNLLKYAIKGGGVVLIIIGVMTFTGWANNISGYLNSFTSSSNKSSVNSEANKDKENSTAEKENKAKEKKVLPAFDFKLTDQYGKEHKLSDYKGKVVFLNFWGTWCPPCRSEMPHIEELYKQHNKNSKDVIILGVANPGGQEKDVEGIKEFLKKNGYSFPVVFDESGEVFMDYAINSFPTTYMIDKEGNIFGYVSGALSKGMMQNIIKQTIEGKRQN